MNKHIQSMKDAVTNYRQTVKEAVTQIEKNNQLYKPAEAEKANEKIFDKLHKERNAVIEKIKTAQEAGQRDVNSWGQLDGGKITDDAKLLDAGAVNPEQFKDLVKKYESNATMLQLLQNYAEKQNEQSGGFAALWGYGEKSNAASAKRFFDTSILPTARGKRETLKQYADQAISIADNIGDFTPGRIGGGPDSPFLDAQIENFGADADF